MPKPRWKVRLTAAAEDDFRSIVVWTAEHFGFEQALRYRATIFAALRELGDGPDTPGTLDRAELGRKLRSLHVARRGRRGRHVILFAASEDDRIDIVRILHDSMDFARHLPSQGDEEDRLAAQTRGSESEASVRCSVYEMSALGRKPFVTGLDRSCKPYARRSVGLFSD